MKDEVISFDDYKNLKKQNNFYFISFQGKSYFNLVFY